MSDADWLALVTTLELSAVTTVVLLILGTPLAWWLVRTRRRMAVAVEAVVARPLVLPPTVLGFYMLVALGPHSPIGGVLQAMDYASAHLLAGGLLAASFLMLLTVYFLNRRYRVVQV